MPAKPPNDDSAAAFKFEFQIPHPDKPRLVRAIRSEADDTVLRNFPFRSANLLDSVWPSEGRR